MDEKVKFLPFSGLLQTHIIMSFSYGKSKNKSSSYSDPTFKFGDSGKLANEAISTSRNNLNTGYQQQGAGFLQGLVNGQGFNFQPSSTLSRLISSINNQSSYDLPQQLAQTRSQYMRTPAGSQAFGLDDTVLKNQLARDTLISQLLQNQYNQDLGMATQAAGNLVNIDDNNFTRAMQILGLTRGEKGAGTSSTSGSQFGVTLKDIASLASAGAGLFKPTP